MASARSTTTSRRSGGGTTTPRGGGADISRATWAGVALVITALIAAISLAVLSPSDPSHPAQVGSVPSATAVSFPADGRVPTEQPEIISPSEGTVTGEWETSVTVAVPEDAIPARLLTLQVLGNGQVLATKERPAGEEIKLPIRLSEGLNQLSAVLVGPGGPGPESPSVAVTLDKTAPALTVSAPKDNTKTSDTTIELSGTSESGAKVTVRNSTKGWSDPAVVGPSGSFETVVPLKRGKNRIVTRAIDDAGNVKRDIRFVIQQDGRPVVKLKAPKSIKMAKLPTRIPLRVSVTDASGDALEGAAVVFSITIPGQPSDTYEDTTNSSGNATWQVSIPRGSRRGDVILASVKVTGPTGQSRGGSAEIAVS